MYERLNVSTNDARLSIDLPPADTCPRFGVHLTYPADFDRCFFVSVLERERLPITTGHS